MALANYTDLTTAITAWVDARTDVSTVEADLVALAEGHFNLELRCRQMLAQTDLTPTSGAVTLPSDFVGVARVIEKASPRRVLDFTPLVTAESQYDTTATGRSNGYTIIGSTLQTIPSTSNDIELTYYQSIPSLETNTTNWLMTKYPNLYLEACQMEAYRYLKMDQDLQISEAKVGSGIMRLNSADDLEFFAQAPRINVGPTP